MKRARPARRIAVLLGVSCCAAVLVDPSLAASPAGGSIGPSAPSIEWDGDYQNLPTDDDFKVDDFKLTVNVPATYWSGNEGGINVSITWPDENDYFELMVFTSKDGRPENPSWGSSQPPPRKSQTVFIPDASGEYIVRAIYTAVVDSGYSGLASFSSEPTGGGARVVFEPGEGLRFAPASIVSAHFLGTEPMMTMERRVEGSTAASPPIASSWIGRCRPAPRSASSAVPKTAATAFGCCSIRRAHNAAARTAPPGAAGTP